MGDVENDPDIVGEVLVDHELVPQLTTTADGHIDESLFEQDEEEAMREAYVKEGYGGNQATKWARENKVFARRVEFNGASDQLLQSVKTTIDPTLLECHSLSGVPVGAPMKRGDFVGIWFDRDTFQIMQDYIFKRLVDKSQAASPLEIREILRVWILMFVYQTSSSKIFHDPAVWYGPARQLRISEQRYDFLVGKLGADLPKLDVFLHKDEEEINAAKIWGGFHQHNDALLEMERNFAKTGKSFIFEGDACDLTIDDDKLRHSSRKFRSLGLMMTGFRGSRIGPVMNAVGVLQTSLIVSIHFSRHGDGPLSIVTSLFRNLGYGVSDTDHTLIATLAATLLIDRGYHIAAVVLFALSLHMRYLGTHSEKIKGWAFTSDSKSKDPNQVLVTVDGAKAAFFASRKVSRVQSNAIAYRNGSKGLGHIHTSLSLNGVWDLLRKKPLTNADKLPPRSYASRTPRVQRLMTGFERQVLELTREQARTPWFEMRVGHVTGTTFYQLLCVIKFRVLEDETMGDDCESLFELLGMRLTKPTLESLAGKQSRQLKALYKGLGYSSKVSDAEMRRVIHRQVPSDSLVFQRIVQSWCMTPIKRKSKAVSESFRQGRLAEIEIAASLGSFLAHESHGFLSSLDLFAVGLLQSKLLPVAAVSPDGVGVVTYIKPNDDDESVAAKDARKVFAFFRSQNYLSEFEGRRVTDRSFADMSISIESSESSMDEDSFVAMQVEVPESVAFVAAFEFKHHSSLLTVTQTRSIVSNDMNNKRTRVLDLRDRDDRELFRKTIPPVTYRSQVLHEAVVCSVGCTVFAVGTESIQYSLVVLIPNNVMELCHDVIRYITTKHLYFLLKEDRSYDKDLSRFPNFPGISWGHASGPDTVKCQLQIMMCLHDLRLEFNAPLPACDGIVPQAVKRWNKGKVPIDDLSKCLAHNLGTFGRISPMTVIWIRWVSTKLYCSWRLWSLYQCYPYVMGEDCASHEKFLHERQRHGGSFEDYLKDVFTELPIPHGMLSGIVEREEEALSMSPLLTARPSTKVHVSRKEWNDDPALVAFRVDGNLLRHIPTSMKNLVENGNIISTAQNQRRHCIYCTAAFHDPNDNNKLKHVSVFPGQNPKKTSNFCSICLAALCPTPPISTGRHANLSCHQRFHKEKVLPKLPSTCVPTDNSQH